MYNKQYKIYKKAEEIIDSYPSHYSKYFYNVSDAGDFGTVGDLVSYLDSVRTKVQHMGFVHVNMNGTWFYKDYVDTLKNLHSKTASSLLFPCGATSFYCPANKAYTG